MNKKRLILLLTLIVLAWFLAERVSNSALSEPEDNELSVSGSFMFIENVGQFAPSVRFVVDGPLGKLTLTDDALWLTVVEPLTERESESLLAPDQERPHLLKKQGVHLRLTFVGANQKVQIEPFAPLQTRLSYFLGNDSAQWRTNVPVWGGVRLKNLYPGIDLELTSQQARFVQRFVLHQESKTPLERVRLAVEGAESLSLEPDQLLLSTALGTLSYPLFELKGAHPAARHQGDLIVAPFQKSQRTSGALDLSSMHSPALPSNIVYATFLGGSLTDWAHDIALSKSGEVYLQGYTQSTDLPVTPGAFDSEYEEGISNTSELYIAKLQPGASQLEYLTYIGGAGDEYGESIAIDGSGAAYITGKTYSPDFPNTPQNLGPYAGNGDAFVLKLDQSGTALSYATYLGGEGNESSYAIAVSESGAAVVTGWTHSQSFPVTQKAWDRTLNPTTCGLYYCQDAFVAKLEPSGDSLSYATYLGGGSREHGRAVTIEQSGAVYVTGYTLSDDFPTTENALDSSYNRLQDVFVTKIAPLGDYLLYSTFLGGGGAEDSNAIVANSVGHVYITGKTQSSNFPTTATAFDTSCGTDGNCNPTVGSLTAETDAFVAKLDATGSTLLLGSFLGGSDFDEGEDLALDASGSIYITGYTRSPSFPTTSGAYIRQPNDIFIVKLNPSGSSLEHSTFFGGLTSRIGGLALSEEDVVYLAGTTGWLDLPITPDAFDDTCGTDGTCNDLFLPPPYDYGYADAFLAKMVLPEVAITNTLPISGGLLTTEQISYTFASATFTDTVVLTHAPRHRLSLPATGDLVPMRFFANLAQGSNQPLEPTQAYSLTLSYSSEELGTIIEETLSLYYWDGSQWVKEGSVVSPVAHTLSATPDHLGWWAVLGETHRTFLPLLHR